MKEKFRKVLNWVLIILAIALLLAMSYCLLTFAVWAANVVPE